MMKGVNFQFTATNKTGPAMQGVQNGLKGMTKATDAANRANQSMMRGMSDNRRAFQQAGFQIADLSVQVAGGQNAMLAFAQQGGQVLQFFGMFGSLAGAALAVFAAFYLGMSKGEAAAKTAGDAMDDFASAIGRYNAQVKLVQTPIEEMRKKFGQFTSEVKAFSQYLANVQLANTFDALKAAIDPLKGDLTEVQRLTGEIALARANLGLKTGDTFTTPGMDIAARDMERYAHSVGMSVDQAQRFAAALDALYTKDASLTQIAQAALQAKTILEELSATGIDLPKPLRDAAISLGEIATLTAESATATDALKIGFDDVASAARAAAMAAQSIGTAAAGALSVVTSLASKMWEAAQARVSAGESLKTMDLAAQYGLYGQGRSAADAANRASGALYNPVGIPGVGKAGGGGGGGTDPLATLREQLKLETELLGMSEAQKRVVNALGSDWQKYGDVVISGLTAQIEAIDAFNQKMADQQSIADTIKSSMSDAFMGIVDGTLKAKDAFKQMASAIIRELFNVLVVQKLVGSFNATQGTGTGIVGFFGKMLTKSFAGGGYTGAGARSGGIDGKGGFLATLHPNETVVDHTAGQGAGGVNVTQNITFGSGVTRAEVQTMIPKIVEATKAAVLDARKRGGSFGGAFA
jgi:hypothetical protein